MKKKMMLFTLIIVGLFSSLNPNSSAQKAEVSSSEQSQKQCTGEKFVMPLSISISNDAFANYLKVTSLPVRERRIAYRELPNEQKASFFKVQFALQFVNRPNMTKEQSDFILGAISKVSADFYDKENPEKVKLAEKIGQELENKAFGIFTPKDASEILAAHFANKDTDVALLQKYEDLLKAGSRARKKLVSGMPVSDRVNIWKTQLAYHLATGKFSKVQNEYILEMLNSLSPSTFEPRDASKEEAAKLLEARTLAVFSRAETYAIFEAIGIQTTVSDEPISGSNPRWCECNYYCSRSGETCGNGNCVRFPECGIFGTSDCYYQCNPT